MQWMTEAQAVPAAAAVRHRQTRRLEDIGISHKVKSKDDETLSCIAHLAGQEEKRKEEEQEGEEGDQEGQ